MKLCTCHTDGCLNQDRAYLWDDDAARIQTEADGIVFLGRIWCGPCGNEITDMVDADPDHPAPPDTFISPPDTLPEPIPPDDTETT